MLVLLLFVCILAPACSLFPCVERRHGSGLLVVCDESVKDMPEALKAAASFGRGIAEDNPDDLGYPWPDPDSGALVVRITGPRGEEAVRAWMAGDARRKGFKPEPVPAPQVPVRFVATDRSFRLLEGIRDGIVPAKDLPDGDLIWQTGPDIRRNVVVVTIDHESDALLRAIASRYGTASIVIRIERRPQNVGY